MNYERFEDFSKNLISNKDFITEWKGDIYVDSTGVVHSLIAFDMYSGDKSNDRFVDLGQYFGYKKSNLLYNY